MCLFLTIIIKNVGGGHCCPPLHIFPIARERDKGKILSARTRHARIDRSSGSQNDLTCYE